MGESRLEGEGSRSAGPDRSRRARANQAGGKKKRSMVRRWERRIYLDFFVTVRPVVRHPRHGGRFVSVRNTMTRRAARGTSRSTPDGPASLRLGAMGCSSSRAKGDASPAGSSSGSKETSAASATASPVPAVARRDDDAASRGGSRVPIPTRSPDSAPAGRPARDPPSSALAATYPIPTPASTSPRVPANPAPAPRESDDGENERWPPRSSRDPSETAFSDIASASIGAEDANDDDASAEDASAASSKRARPSRASATYAELSKDAVPYARAETVDRSDDERARSAARVEGALGAEHRQHRRSGGRAQDSDAARGRGAESDVRRATRVVAKAVAAVRAATAKDARRVQVADASDDAKHSDGASGVGASEGENEDDGNGDGDDEEMRSRGARFVPGVGVTSARRAAAARAARRAMERARGRTGSRATRARSS